MKIKLFSSNRQVLSLVLLVMYYVLRKDSDTVLDRLLEAFPVFLLSVLASYPGLIQDFSNGSWKFNWRVLWFPSENVITGQSSDSRKEQDFL